MNEEDKNKAIDKMIRGEEGKSAIKKWKDKKKKDKTKTKKLSKKWQGKLKPRSILKDSKATVTIRERQPAEYVNRFFKEEQEDAEMALFFK